VAATDNLPVEIGTHRYVVDLKGLQYRPLNSIRQMQDLSREPSDATFDNQGVWKRTQSDFILGSGQNYLDQEDESDRRRFRRSKGVNVWDRRQLTLHNDVSLIGSVGSGATGAMAKTGSGVYFASGGSAVHYDGTTLTQLTNEGGGNINSLVVIGGFLYVADGTTLRRVAIGSTALATVGALTPDVLGTGGGRLVGADAALLYEVLYDGTKVDIYTHFDSTFTWKKIIGAPNGIYCSGNDSSRSVVYLLTVADATGQLTPPYPVLSMPDGEFIRDMLFFGGVMVLATNLGVRLATINGSGFLTAGPLITIGNVECLDTDGFDIWFGWTNFDATSTGLGRMRPSRFTETLAPAYASDIMFTDQGEVRACASFGGKRYLLFNDSGTGRVYGESTAKVPSGQLWTGAITYGTPERKAVHSIEGFWDALPAGSSVTMAVLAGLGGTSQTGGVANSTATSTSQRGALAATYEGEEAEILITLTRGTTTSLAPVVRRWTLRAMPMAYRTFEIILPVMLTSTARHIAGGNDQTVHFDPKAEFDYLLGLVQNRASVTMTIGTRSETVVVDSISIGPDIEGVGAVDWTRTQNWVEGVWALRLLTMEPAA